MTSYTIESGKVYLTDGTISGDTITTSGIQVCIPIKAKSIKHTFSKMLISYSMPATSETQSANTYVVDLRRGTENIIILGYIQDDPEILRYKIGQTPSGHSVYYKKQLLRYLYGKGEHPDYPSYKGRRGVFYVVWGEYNSEPLRNRRQVYKAIISKLEVSEEPKYIQGTFKNAGSGGESITGRLMKFDVNITLLIAQNR